MQHIATNVSFRLVFIRIWDQGNERCNLHIKSIITTELLISEIEGLTWGLQHMCITRMKWHNGCIYIPAYNVQSERYQCICQDQFACIWILKKVPTFFRFAVFGLNINAREEVKKIILPNKVETNHYLQERFDWGLANHWDLRLNQLCSEWSWEAVCCWKWLNATAAFTFQW